MNSEVQKASRGLAEAQRRLVLARKRHQAAKHRRKSAKELARRARKQARFAKSEVKEAQLMLGKAEKKLAQASKQAAKERTRKTSKPSRKVPMKRSIRPVVKARRVKADSPKKAKAKRGVRRASKIDSNQPKAVAAETKSITVPREFELPALPSTASNPMVQSHQDAGATQGGKGERPSPTVAEEDRSD